MLLANGGDDSFVRSFLSVTTDLAEQITLWRVSMFQSYIFRRETLGSRNQHLQDQLAKLVGLLLLSSLCCPLHAQNGPPSAPASNSTASNSTTSNSTTSISPASNSPTSNSTSNSSTSNPPTSTSAGPLSSGSSDDFITSETNVITPETRVLISAPYAIFSTSLYVFTSGIPIRPIYIQAPSGLMVWLTIQCRGGAARVILPQSVANFTMVQTDPTGEWILPSLPLNNSWPVTGLGIKFNQNVSIANNALGTLLYGKGADNDIVGKATMTITLNWNATSARDNRVIAFTESKTIYIWAPTALTSLSTFQATVAGVCMVGICGLCCIGCLNSVGVSSLRRFNVLMARETRDQQECEQNRVFNPMWMPCAPSQPGYYNIESTPNSVLLMQRRREIKSLILRTPTTFSLMDRLTRAKYLKSSDYVGCFGFQLPWATAPPRRLVDSSSEDEFPAAMPIAARRGSRRGPLQANQFREVSMMRQQLRARPSVQLPPNYSQQRAPSYNWPQVQAQTAMYNPQNQMYPGAPNYPGQQTAQAQAQAAMYNNQNQMYPGAPNYPQQTAQAQAQGAMYINQNQMYLGAPNYPQQTAQAQAAMYNPQNQMYPGALNNPQQTAQAPAMNPGNQYDMSQSPGAPRNRLNYETITVGFAFIHHRFAQDVPSDAKPLSKETPGTEDFDPCEAQGAGHGARLPGERAQHRKGKEPMSDGSSLEQSRSGCQDTILHSFLPRISLNPTTKLNFHHSASIQEIVTGSSESGSVRSERDVSELQKLDVLPREELELQGDERSEDSDRASESFGSPLTDLYEDVLESCSSSNTTPERIDATCRRESPLAPVQPSSEH